MDLASYVRYCLGYIRIARRISLGKDADSVTLSEAVLPLQDVLSAELETNQRLSLALKTYYRYETDDVPPELQAAYKQEKKTAKAVEDIYHRCRNDQFTKRVQLRFGYFTVHLPVTSAAPQDEDDELDLMEEVETKEISFPLLSLNVDVHKDSRKLLISPLEPEFEVNLSALEPVLGENYLEMVGDLGKLEAQGKEHAKPGF